MKENKENWMLFQIFDAVLERWSPVYCGATVVSIRMEVEEMVKKTNGRPVKLRILGVIQDGIFAATYEAEETYGDFSKLEVNYEVPESK